MDTSLVIPFPISRQLKTKSVCMAEFSGLITYTSRISTILSVYNSKNSKYSDVLMIITD